MKNFLSFSQKLALATWLRANLTRLQSSRPTLEVMASEASQDLKFTIHAPNLVSVAKGIEIELPKCQVSGGAKRCDPLARHFLALLYEKCGESVPNELRDFLNASMVPGKEK